MPNATYQIQTVTAVDKCISGPSAPCSFTMFYSLRNKTALINCSELIN